MNRLFVTLIFIGAFSMAQAQKTKIEFDVMFNSDPIGTLTATSEANDSTVVKDLHSNTDAKVFMLSIHVESEVKTHVKKGVLLNATAFRHANRGSEDIQTTVKKLSSSQYQVIKNGQEKKLPTNGIKFCVIDLYFKEPKGVTTAFSNTIGEFLKITPMGNGEYVLNMPDGKKNKYTYVNGALTTVKSSIAVGEVVFKRKK
jgi:hypothetical protein